MTAQPSSKDDSKTLLIKAAKKIFADKGYDGATVKDIADEAGLNISLVSYHFNGKENLYRECLISVGERGLHSAERLLKEPKNRDEFRVKLTLFIEEFIERHFEEIEVSEIIYRESTSDNKVIRELFDSVFFKFFAQLENFFKSSIKNKIIRKENDAHCCAFLLLGSLCHSLRHDELHVKKFGKSLNEPQFRKKFIDQLLLSSLGGDQT